MEKTTEPDLDQSAPCVLTHVIRTPATRGNSSNSGGSDRTDMRTNDHALSHMRTGVSSVAMDTTRVYTSRACAHCTKHSMTHAPTGRTNRLTNQSPSYNSSTNRSIFHHILPLTVLFLLTFAQGQGQGSQDERLQWEVQEEVPPGTLVGTLPVRDGLTYRFATHQDGLQRYFTLDGDTGHVRTAGRLDREALPTGMFDLFVQSTPPRHLIELRISVTDINDNVPTFARPVLDISFSETDQPGTQVCCAGLSLVACVAAVFLS